MRASPGDPALPDEPLTPDPPRPADASDVPAEPPEAPAFPAEPAVAPLVPAEALPLLPAFAPPFEPPFEPPSSPHDAAIVPHVSAAHAMMNRRAFLRTEFGAATSRFTVATELDFAQCLRDANAAQHFSRAV
jgi:hypothetical protein